MLRIVLVFLVVFLIVRAFILMGTESRTESPAREPEKGKTAKKSGVPKELGEYIEFEEVEGKG